MLSTNQVLTRQMHCSRGEMPGVHVVLDIRWCVAIVTSAELGEEVRVGAILENQCLVPSVYVIDSKHHLGSSAYGAKS